MSYYQLDILKKRMGEPLRIHIELQAPQGLATCED